MTPEMKFRSRKTTDHLCVVKSDTGGLPVPELQAEARRRGDLAIGYHYVVQENGKVEQGREPYAVAGHNFENPENSIYILVDIGDRGRLTDAQQVALTDLLDTLQGEHPQARLSHTEE